MKARVQGLRSGFKGRNCLLQRALSNATCELSSAIQPRSPLPLGAAAILVTMGLRSSSFKPAQAKLPNGTCQNTHLALNQHESTATCCMNPVASPVGILINSSSMFSILESLLLSHWSKAEAWVNCKSLTWATCATNCGSKALRPESPEAYSNAFKVFTKNLQLLFVSSLRREGAKAPRTDVSQQD